MGEENAKLWPGKPQEETSLETQMTAEAYD